MKNLVNKVKFFIKAALGVFLSITHGWCVDSSIFDDLTLSDLPTYSVFVKNVGQGSCTIILNHENAHHLVIDAGSSSDAPSGLEGRISKDFGFSAANSDIPFMDNSITIIVSHSDQDHIDLFKTVFGLNQSLLNRVGQIVLGDHFDNYFRLNTAGTKPVQETRDFIRDFVLRIFDYKKKLISLSHNDVRDLNIRTLLDTMEVAVDVPYVGFIPKVSIPRQCFFKSDQIGEIDILGANSGAESEKVKDTNTNSAVVRLSLGGKNILIMGDATGHTTGRILETTDASTLKASLSVPSHHGADNEAGNHISWSAVTASENIAISHGFNKGYGHPTLTAVANFMVTGLSEDEIIPKDNHLLSIFNTPATYALTMEPFRMKRVGDYQEWVMFSTDRPIYGTGMSGDLTYVFSKEGTLIDFKREH